MTVFYFARHGETDDNARLVFQGQGGRGLNARGRAQARRLAQRMQRARVSAVVASDLERAVETARFVSTACGVAATYDPDLREVDLGAWTGKSHEEIADLYPEEWSAWAAGLDVRRGGGETYAELAERVDRAVARACAMELRDPFLLVSHGGAIKSWVAKILGVSAEGLRALAGVGNAGITIVERDARGRVKLHAWNDTSHLEGLLVEEQTD
ncbi:MAG: histidine phosphatase family protein [Labilithrix sp.]|nr:histidine phosphatase family protein [Labilithrix sp.]MBX3222716.1 histidine phosphatase family protein [Labilithrix sp.]